MGKCAGVVSDWIVVMIVGVVFASGFCEKAHGADSERSADVRCVVVGLRMANMTTTQQRSAGIMVATYYLGRLGARSSHAQIEQLIESEAEKMTSAEFRENATRCGQALAAEGQEIQKIIANLSHKGLGETTEK